MKRIALFTLLVFITSACLEYKEKMKLNSDGSGEIKFAIGLSETLFEMKKNSNELKEFDADKLKQKYSDKKGIKFISSKTYTEAGDRWMEVNISFDSIEDLMSASVDSSNFGMIGNIKLYEDKNGNMVFERIISQESKLKENDTTDSDKNGELVNTMFGNYKWTYELTLPGKIISTNASSNDIDEKTNTVKWFFSLGALSKSTSMMVTYTKTSSVSITMLILLVIGAIVLALVLLYLLKLKKDEEVHV